MAAVLIAMTVTLFSDRVTPDSGHLSRWVPRCVPPAQLLSPLDSLTQTKGPRPSRCPQLAKLQATKLPGWFVVGHLSRYVDKLVSAKI